MPTYRSRSGLNFSGVGLTWLLRSFSLRNNGCTALPFIWLAAMLRQLASIHWRFTP